MVIDSREVHAKKAHAAIVVTLSGMSMDFGKGASLESPSTNLSDAIRNGDRCERGAMMEST